MSTPKVQLRGLPRLSQGDTWTAQQRADIKAIWDDLVRSVNGSILPIVDPQVDAVTFTPFAGADISTQANTQAVGNLTMNAPVGAPADGQVIEFIFKSTNVQTFVWNGIYKGSTTTALPATTTGATKTDRLWFQYNIANSKWELINAKYGYT